MGWKLRWYLYKPLHQFNFSNALPNICQEKLLGFAKDWTRHVKPSASLTKRIGDSDGDGDGDETTAVMAAWIWCR